MSLAEILWASRPSGPKPAPDLALGRMPRLSHTHPTTTEGTKNKQSTRLALPSSGSIWHCVRPQAMLNSPARVNLQLTPLDQVTALDREDTSTKPTTTKRPLGQQEDNTGEQIEKEKTAHNLGNTSDFSFPWD